MVLGFRLSVINVFLNKLDPFCMFSILNTFYDEAPLQYFFALETNIESEVVVLRLPVRRAWRRLLSIYLISVMHIYHFRQMLTFPPLSPLSLYPLTSVAPPSLLCDVKIVAEATFPPWSLIKCYWQLRGSTSFRLNRLHSTTSCHSVFTLSEAHAG